MNQKEQLTLFILPEIIYVFSMLKNKSGIKKQLFTRNFFALRTVVQIPNFVKYLSFLLKNDNYVLFVFLRL